MSVSLREKILKKHVAIPADHGSWVFLLSPLLIGLLVAGKFSMPSLYLVVAALAVFFFRQPVTIIVKMVSGRRVKTDWVAAWFWAGVYALAALVMGAGLLARGYAYVLVLALPGLVVFVWYLSLVSKRTERRKMGVEIVGSGVLALAAPAAYWIGVGYPAVDGWFLFGLAWLQSAASIVYAYLRLQQRSLPSVPALGERLRAGRRAMMYAGFNLFLSIGLAVSGKFSAMVFLPYGLQFAETLWGTLVPAVGVKPTRIGFRQLIVSTLFTILFIIVW